MKRDLLAIVIAVVVGAAIASTIVVAPLVDPSGQSGGIRPSWSSNFNGCCFDDGIRNAAITTPPIVHTGTSTLYLVGSVSVGGWTRWNGTANVTGNCPAADGPAGACDVYVAIWSPAAWNAYAAGGPMSPFWCYRGNTSECTNVSSAYFTTPSLVALEGQTWDIVIWNVQPYGLIGNYSFTTYVSPDFWAS